MDAHTLPQAPDPLIAALADLETQVAGLSPDDTRAHLMGMLCVAATAMRQRYGAHYVLGVLDFVADDMRGCGTRH
ncbi:MAG: hypothetical protein JNM98_06150 [Rhodocyclaceae bacterium]|nr:hypothetical protein [Rhodocyclaceae bacterium]